MITDLSYLRSMAADDMNFIREMVDLFKEQIDEFSVEMPKLLEAGEYNKLARMAHKAKSSVAVMGMTREADLLKSLELKADEAKEVESFSDMIATFVTNAQLAIEELDAYLNNP